MSTYSVKWNNLRKSYNQTNAFKLTNAFRRLSRGMETLSFAQLFAPFAWRKTCSPFLRLCNTDRCRPSFMKLQKQFNDALALSFGESSGR